MKQVKALTLCLSRETLAIVHNLGLSEAQIMTKGIRFGKMNHLYAHVLQPI